ncbi:acyltransferase family protein [Actinomadura hibisca]|uniref:acyltransferase family protein n=1 Tax=Actinomadura hibisca TaxID=68565 RepID=UPI000B021A1F|nr:acyltransferase family protein [Actinomadura hibisca]
MTYTTRPLSAPEPPPHPRRSAAHPQTGGAPEGGRADGPGDRPAAFAGPPAEDDPLASGYPLAPAGESPAVQHPGIFASAAFPEPAEPLAAPVPPEQGFAEPGGPSPATVPIQASQPETAYTTGPLRHVPSLGQENYPAPPQAADPLQTWPPTNEPDAGAKADAWTDAGANARSNTGTDSGAWADVEARADAWANAENWSDTGADAWADAGTGTTQTLPPTAGTEQAPRHAADTAQPPPQASGAAQPPPHTAHTIQPPSHAGGAVQAPPHAAGAVQAPPHTAGAVQAPPVPGPAAWAPQPGEPAWAPQPGAPAPRVPSGGAAHSEPPAAPQAPGTAPAPRRKERDPYFDNAKFLAILLVVIGHSLANKMNVPLAKGLYIFIYMFHMPLFIVITGYFSRNWTFSGGKARKLITNVGVPYVVFETAYSLYDWLVGRNELEVSLLNPYFLTWFLCALFMWRLSTPVWQQIRWPLGVAMVFSLLSYMSDLGGTFDVHRVIGLLPFYVLGLMLRPEHFELLKKPMARVVGIVVMFGGLGVAWFAKDRMTHTWIYWKTPHQDLGVDNVTGTLMRLAMFACAIVLVAAFLTLVPQRRAWFTALGSTTLYAYLLHGFVTRFLQFFDLWGMPWMNTWWGIAVIIVCAAGVGTFLCSKPVVKVMSWALEPQLKWAFTGLRRPGGSRRPQPATQAETPAAVRPAGPPAPETGPFTGAFGAPPVRRHGGTAPADLFNGPTAEDRVRPPAGDFGRPPAGATGAQPVEDFGRPPADGFGGPADGFGRPPAGGFGQPPVEEVAPPPFPRRGGRA